MKQKLITKKDVKELSKVQIGDMLVEIKYSDSDKKIEECMLNILKLKIK